MFKYGRPCYDCGGTLRYRNGHKCVECSRVASRDVEEVKCVCHGCGRKVAKRRFMDHLSKCDQVLWLAIINRDRSVGEFEVKHG